MLSDDATFSMPPLESWFGGEGGSGELAAFMGLGPISGYWDWRHVRTTANGQPALAFYARSRSRGDQTYLPFALNVLSFDGQLINDVTCFVCRATTSEDPADYGRWVEQPVDPERVRDYFLRFGLPERLG